MEDIRSTTIVAVKRDGKTAIAGDGQVTVGQTVVMKNSAVKVSTERGRGKLVKLSPNDHIDGTAALLDALTVHQKWYGEIGEQLRN